MLLPAVGHAVDETKVTAQKREEARREVPMSLSAFNQADLDKKGIEGVGQLQLQVPSMVAGGGLRHFTLRGVGAEVVGPGAEAGFAIHQNGVYASRTRFVDNSLYDLERIEILRGPQGALYGRNTTGGVMKIITRKPTDEFEAGLDYEYGSYDKSRARAVLNAPITNLDAAARLALLYTHHRGYYNQRFTEPRQRSFDRNDISVRASLSWQLVEDLRADLTWTFIREDGQGLDHKLLGNPRVTDTMGLGLDDFGPNGATNRGVGARPSPAPSSIRQGNENERQILDNTIHFGTLALTWVLDDFTVKSISGYQGHELFNSYDGDHTELDVRRVSVVDDLRSWSTEVNVSFDDGGPFRFWFGSSYFDEKVGDSGETHSQVQPNDAVGPAIPEINARAVEIQRTNPSSPFAPSPDGFEDELRLSAQANNRTVESFGAVTYEVSESWRVRGGMRYSYTDRRFVDRSIDSDQRFDDTFLGGSLPFYFDEHGSTYKETWNALTGRVSTDFDLDETTLIYSSVSTGNRPGGFNFLSSKPFRAEDVLAVEIGSKSSFFGNRLQLSTSAFYYDYDDIQVQLLSPETNRNTNTNIPSAEIFGTELEWLTEPLHNFVINGTFGWLSTRYDEDFVAAPGRPCFGGASRGDIDACPDSVAFPDGVYRIDRESVENIKGNHLSRSPEFSLNLGTQYAIDLAGFDSLPSPLHGVLTTRFDYTFRDEIYFDVFNRDAYRQGAWNSGNLRLLYDKDLANWRFRLEVYARNLWDEEVLTNVTPASDGLHQTGFYNEPRTYGFRVTTKLR